MSWSGRVSPASRYPSSRDLASAMARTRSPNSGLARTSAAEDNWNVEHLGANMPPDELVDFCARHDITVAVLSVTNSDVEPIAQSAATALRNSATPVVIGGPGRTIDDLLADVRTATSHATTH